jgi:hypothetical protein
VGVYHPILSLSRGKFTFYRDILGMRFLQPPELVAKMPDHEL